MLAALLAAAIAAPSTILEPVLSLRHPAAILQGNGPGAVAGDPVAALGDVNGDGIADFATANGRQRHDVFVVFGPLRGTQTLAARVGAGHGFRITGDRPLGVTRVGDVNGDGLADVLVYGVSVLDETPVLPAYAVFGSRTPVNVDVRTATSRELRITGPSAMATTVTGGGDVNGDGRDDVVVGYDDTPNSSVASVLFGRRLGSVDARTPDVRVTGGVALDVEDGGPAIVGDLNGDGRSDVFVETRTGGAAVYGRSSGDVAAGTAGFRLTAPSGYGLYIAAAAGDVDGNGRPDLLLAARGDEGDVADQATVYVVLNPRGDVDFRGAFDGYAHPTHFVTSLVDAGDMNGDGRSDALIGLGVADAGKNSERGAAEVLFGHALGAAPVPAALYWDSPAATCACPGRGANAGNSVAPAGDQNGDGLADLLVGVPWGSDGAYTPPPGSAYLVLAPHVVVGTAGPDTARGGPTNDLLLGLGGNDTLIGGGGSDTLIGGAGDDVLVGGAGDDRLEGDAGNDREVGGAGADDLFGGSGPTDNAHRSGSGADRLAGGAGDDLLSGGDGDDRLDGGAGSDLAFGETGDDRLAGGTGDDLLLGDGYADYTRRWIDAYGIGRDAILAGPGDDLIWGGGGADTIDGGPGTDTGDGRARARDRDRVRNVERRRR
jgi:Ca2+-binding RTX toxin-like protein